MGAVLWQIPLPPWEVKLCVAATYTCGIDFRRICG